MKKYRVYYIKNPTFMPQNITVSTLPDTHVELIDIDAESLDDVYFHMQAENWSPFGEAKTLIQQKGLTHTSMCVDDVIYDVEEDKYFTVEMIGFREIK